MGKLEQVLAEQTKLRKGPVCSVTVALTQLDADDRKALTAAFANPAYQHTQIAGALKAIGMDVSPTAISRHRRNECMCGRG